MRGRAARARPLRPAGSSPSATSCWGPSSTASSSGSTGPRIPAEQGSSGCSAGSATPATTRFRACSGCCWASSPAGASPSSWCTARVRAETDPARRRLLTGAATGAVSALGAAALAGGGAALRSLFGWGRDDTGWSAVNHGIQAKVESLSPSYPEPWKNARVEAYRTLGRTGWRISDVVVGSGRIRDQKGTDVVRLALDRGVTYVDTSPDYSAAGSEECVGRALRGVRDQVFVATKWCTPWGHLGAGRARRGVREGGRGEPPPPRHRLRRPRPRAQLRRARAPDGPEHVRGLRPAEAGRQGALPRLLFAHAEPGRGGGDRDRLGPLRRDDARLPPRHLAEARRADRARAPRAGHGRGGDEDAEGREAPRPRRLPRARGRLLPGRAALVALEPGGVRAR